MRDLFRGGVMIVPNVPEIPGKPVRWRRHHQAQPADADDVVVLPLCTQMCAARPGSAMMSSSRRRQ
jgi:hypothetical protein